MDQNDHNLRHETLKLRDKILQATDMDKDS